MKRICFLIFCLILLFSLSVNAAAAENGLYETAGDLWNHWCKEDRVPDFITGIWSTDGSHDNLTFGLLPGEEGEQAKELILSWIIDDSTVTFVTQTYSRNYLWAIMEDVNTYFEKGLGFMSAGPSEYDNVVYIELHTDYENNPDSLAAVAELEEKYGGAVSISFTDNIYHFTQEVSTEPPVLFFPVPDPTSPASPLPMLLILCAVLLCALILTEQKRRRLLTHMGSVEQTPLTTREVKTQVRSAVPKVPKTLDARIHATLDEISDQKM